MTSVEKYNSLNAEFSKLAALGCQIRMHYGLVGSCSLYVRAELVRIGKMQELIKQQLEELFRLNGGSISM